MLEDIHFLDRCLGQVRIRVFVNLGCWCSLDQLGVGDESFVAVVKAFIKFLHGLEPLKW